MSSQFETQGAGSDSTETGKNIALARPKQSVSYISDAALLALLTIFILHPLALTNLIPGSGDMFAYFIPYRAYANAALRHGHIPLWDPYLFMGVPFLANSQAAVLYPLHWPLAFLSPGRAVAWSIVLHAYLLALFTYFYARLSAGLSRGGALVAASLLAFGGFIAGAAMHLNQLNAIAWFPLALLLWDVAMGKRKLVGMAALGIVVAMMVLAGHTQATYIAMFGLALYAAWTAGYGALSWKDLARRLAAALLIYAGAAAIGALLAAAQLLPTLELSRYSLRQGGLTYRQAVSFSLRPTKLLWTLLPPYGVNLAQKFGTPAFSEYIAYFPIAGWVLIVIGLLKIRMALKSSLPRHQPLANDLARSVFPPMLAAIGFLLALGGYDPLYYLLYRLIPGFNLFRAPARWMFLTSFGLAMTAGIGFDAVIKLDVAHIFGKDRPHSHRTTVLSGLAIWLVVMAELTVAIRAMPISHPTAPQALESVRNPTAYLLSGQEAPTRVLSISNIKYDPGDLANLRRSFGPYLTQQGLYDLIVDTKEKEILAPNLSLYFHIQTVDGYDGGLLPLKRYNELLRLFLPEKRIVPDGRLREQLKRIPSQRLLNLLNVKYVITDKVHDQWIDDRYYDLQQAAGVSAGTPMTLKGIPQEPLTDIGIVWDGTEGTIMAESVGGGTYRWNLDERSARGVDLPGGEKARLTVLEIPGAAQPCEMIRLQKITIASEAGIRVHGVTVWDERTGAHWALSMPRPANLKRVFSGDVKIYQNEKLLPRAYMVYHAERAQTAKEALALMSNKDFDPSVEVVLTSVGTQHTASSPRATHEARAAIVLYEPERVVVKVHTDIPGYLVLSDTYYPGWKATLDGRETHVLQADLLFRAVQIPTGEHTVEFVYRPWPWKVGVTISLATLVCLALGTLLLALGKL